MTVGGRAEKVHGVLQSRLDGRGSPNVVTVADVLDHRFGAGAPFTVGIEEEYMLLDPSTFDLVAARERILEAEAGGPFAACISPELFTSLVEFHTPVCADVPEAGRQLRRIRRHAIELVRTPRAASRLRRAPIPSPLRATAHHAARALSRRSSSSCSTPGAVS